MKTPCLLELEIFVQEAALAGRKQGSEQLNEALKDLLDQGEVQNIEPLCDHQLSRNAKVGICELMFPKQEFVNAYREVNGFEQSSN